MITPLVRPVRDPRDIEPLLDFWRARCGNVERRHFISLSAVTSGMANSGLIFIAVQDPDDDSKPHIVGSLAVEFGIACGATLKLLVAPSREVAQELVALAAREAGNRGYGRLLAMLPQPERTPWLPELGFEGTEGTWFFTRELTEEEMPPEMPPRATELVTS